MLRMLLDVVDGCCRLNVVGVVEGCWGCWRVLEAAVGC